MQLDGIYKIIQTIVNYFWIVTLVDIILLGLPRIKISQKLEKNAFVITKENFSEAQGKVECSAFASAYVYRHLGKSTKGLDLYKEMPCKSLKGYVYCRGIVLLAKKYGFRARLRTGNLTALKNTVAKGNPVIVMVRSKIGSRGLHYIPIVGYDEESMYAVDSIENLRNTSEENYNRVIPVSEFRKLWNTSMLKQPLFLNLFFEIES